MIIYPQNKSAAFCKLVRPSLEDKGLQIASKIEVKNKFHEAYITTNGKKFYILFKKEKFMSYAKQFPDEREIGESINVDSMWEAIDRKFDWILITYNDGYIYAVKPEDWKNYANEHKTYRPVNKKHCVMEYGKKVEIQEVTASIKLKVGVRWNLSSQLSENTESSET